MFSPNLKPLLTIDLRRRRRTEPRSCGRPPTRRGPWGVRRAGEAPAFSVSSSPLFLVKKEGQGHQPASETRVVGACPRGPVDSGGCVFTPLPAQSGDRRPSLCLHSSLLGGLESPILVEQSAHWSWGAAEENGTVVRPPPSFWEIHLPRAGARHTHSL